MYDRPRLRVRSLSKSEIGVDLVLPYYHQVMIITVEITGVMTPLRLQAHMGRLANDMTAVLSTVWTAGKNANVNRT